MSDRAEIGIYRLCYTSRKTREWVFIELGCLWSLGTQGSVVYGRSHTRQQQLWKQFWSLLKFFLSENHGLWFGNPAGDQQRQAGRSVWHSQLYGSVSIYKKYRNHPEKGSAVMWVITVHCPNDGSPCVCVAGVPPPRPEKPAIFQSDPGIPGNNH